MEGVDDTWRRASLWIYDIMILGNGWCAQYEWVRRYNSQDGMGWIGNTEQGHSRNITVIW